MTNLVPVKRAKKNGVMVTKWVKPDAVSSSDSGFPVPSPVSVSPRASSAMLDEYTEFFAAYDCADTDYARELASCVQKMDQDTAETLLNKMYDGGNFRNIWDISRITCNIYGGSSLVSHAYRDVAMNNFINMVPDYGMLPNSDEEYVLDFTEATFIDVGGLDAHELYTEEQQRVYSSVAAIATHIFKSPMVFEPVDGPMVRGKGFDIVNERIALTDTRGVDLMLARPEHIDILREQMMERGIFSAEVMQEMLASKAVGNGVL